MLGLTYNQYHGNHSGILQLSLYLNVKVRLLVDFELLETRISRGGFLHLSAIVQSELDVLHSFSPCCIFYGWVHLIRLLHLLSQWAFNSLLLLLSGSVEDAPLLPVCFARWMAKSLLLHEKTIVEVTHVAMKPWPPLANLHNSIASEPIETGPVNSFVLLRAPVLRLPVVVQVPTTVSGFTTSSSLNF